MDEKQQQMEKDWKISEGLDRAWRKVREKEARDNEKPEVVLSNLMDKQSEKMADIDRAWKEHGENKNKPNYEKMNQTIRSIYPKYNNLEEAEGDRRDIFIDIQVNAEGIYNANIYPDKPQEFNNNKSSEIVHRDFIDIPAHWSNEQAKKFYEMSFNGCIISENLFDKYIKSNAKDVNKFLSAERVKMEAFKNLRKANKYLP